MKTYIYTLDCPNSGTPKYVGKTINPKQRLEQHIRSNENTKKYAWIKSLKNDGLKPKMTIVDSYENDCDFWEDWYIEYYKFLGFNLKNHKGGGIGGRLSSETKAKISAKLKGKKKSEEHRLKSIKNLNVGVPWNKGKKLNDKQKEKAVLALEQFRENNPGYWKGKKRSPETVEKLKRIFRERYPKKEKIKKIYNHIKVKAFDENKNFVFEIKLKDCPSLGYQKSNIINCINGKRKKANGYTWEYSK
jgi:hypothetical protein